VAFTRIISAAFFDLYADGIWDVLAFDGTGTLYVLILDMNTKTNNNMRRVEGTYLTTNIAPHVYEPVTFTPTESGTCSRLTEPVRYAY